MDIRNWITFEEAEDNRDEQVDAAAQASLAGLIQQRLRVQIDPGIDISSARRAQAIRASYEDGQIVINEDDQAKLFNGQREESADDSQPPAANLDDLFRPGSGVPESISNPDGSSTLVFRSITAANLFNEQNENSRTETVQRAISDVLRFNTVDAIEGAQREADRLRSGIKHR